MTFRIGFFDFKNHNLFCLYLYSEFETRLYSKCISILHNYKYNTLYYIKSQRHMLFTHLHSLRNSMKYSKVEYASNTTYKVYNKYLNLDLTNYKVQT